MGRKNIDEEIENQMTLIISMLKDDATDKEIVEALGISASTWKRKKKENARIRQIIEEVTDEKNQKVEDALFKCCTGYHYYEEVATKVKIETEGENGTVLVTEDVKISNVKKYRGPDINAQKYWLNNKKKATWKDDPHKVANESKLTKIKVDESKLKEKLLEGDE